MPEKERCQSCGMPLAEGFYGTHADGTPEREYCKFCFQEGSFTEPQLTVQGMIEKSVEFMSKNLNFSETKARELSQAVIPGLKRWRGGGR